MSESQPVRRWTSANTFATIFIVLVLAVLAVFVVHAITAMPVDTKPYETRAMLMGMEMALEDYKNDMGEYPGGDFTAMIRALTDPDAGWKRASEVWSPNRKMPPSDAWGMPFYYTRHDQYPERGVERTLGEGRFYNPGRYQLYSMGPNMKTWPNTVADGGHPRLAGTEPDDIRNWHQETSHGERPEAYR
jgi:type II secretion system (T2SS) protein G